MKKTNLVTYLILAVSTAITTGCVLRIGGPQPPDEQQEPSDNIVHSCTLVAPDNVFEVPEHQNFPPTGAIYRVSSMDHYWYKTPSHIFDRPCDRYVVDVLFNNKSNRDCEGPGQCTYPDVLLHADPFNLPSTNGLNRYGRIPNNVYDCNSFRLYASFYEKLATEESFRFLSDKVIRGIWNDSNQVCNFSPNLVSEDATSGGEGAGILQSGEGRSENWDTYRVATKLFLRSHPQKVRVLARKYSEPPA